MAFKTLNIGTTALLTQRRALDVVGQNIANASTPGYSRQRLNPEAVRPDVQTFGAIGGGVEIKSIARIADEFLEKQVRVAKGTLERLDSLGNAYDNLQVFFNELTDNDLSNSMDEFWNATSDFSNNVEDISVRRALLSSGETLANRFQVMENQMREFRVQQNSAIVDTVSTINRIVEEVAGLNEDIVKIEAGGANGVIANDLRDQRTERLKTLAGIMNIKATEQPNGSVVVTQGSRLVVIENRFFSLSTRTQNSDDVLIEVPVFSADDDDVTLGDGLLAGQVQIRDTIIKGFKDDIDQLAASFSFEFNRVFSQNIGLRGFSNLTGTTEVIDPTQTLNQLQFNFTPKPGTFAVQNGNMELVVHSEVSGEDTIVNIEIDLDGRTANPDTILFDPALPTAANALVTKLQNAFNSVQSSAFTVGVDLQNRVQITANQSDFTFGFGRDTSGVLATLGLNTFFTASDAGDFTVNSEFLNNPDRIGGAKEFTPGDNTGALALLDLRTTAVLNNNTSDLDDFYQGIVGRLGVEASRTTAQLETQQDILIRMENQREDLSGVNMDEELAQMIRFQRSFQSAARFISTADSILETLINM